MKKIFTVLAISVAVVCLIPIVFLAACSRNDEMPLSFDSGKYEITAGDDTQIMITSGTGNYHVLVSDDSVLMAGYSRTGKHNPGNLILTGLESGETIVTVTDNITNETIDLRIVVKSGEDLIENIEEQ